MRCWETRLESLNDQPAGIGGVACGRGRKTPLRICPFHICFISALIFHLSIKEWAIIGKLGSFYVAMR